MPLLLIAFTVAILGWATLRASAAWHYLAARSAMAAMDESGRFTQADIDHAGGRVDRALRRFPRHPDYLDLAGRLQVLQASQPGVLGKARREYLESALAYYRQALSVRPLWPYSWANLLEVKDRLGVVDDEFVLALQRSIETGPWTPRVQLQVVNSGLRYWDALAAREQRMVREKAVDALSIQPREVLELVKAFGRPGLICGEAVEHVQISRWCEKVLAR